MASLTAAPIASGPIPRLTPWVKRLLIINAVVLLLQQTVITSDTVAGLVSFAPLEWAKQPWSFFTYMFVHAGLLHLAANSLALFVFGPAVEQRFGSTKFIAFYIGCGLAGAVFTLLMAELHMVPWTETVDGVTVPFAIVGASAAIMGVAYAFARLLPDMPLIFLLLPIPIKAKWMIPLMASYDVIAMLARIPDHIAHSAHVGGLLAAVLYFVLRDLARPPETIPIRPMRPRVPVAARGAVASQPAAAPRREPASAAGNTAGHTDETAEIDRVLDKISASGLDSLTPDERRFLDAISRRRRDLN